MISRYTASSSTCRQGHLDFIASLGCLANARRLSRGGLLMGLCHRRPTPPAPIAC